MAFIFDFQYQAKDSCVKSLSPFGEKLLLILLLRTDPTTLCLTSVAVSEGLSCNSLKNKWTFISTDQPENAVE